MRRLVALLAPALAFALALAACGAAGQPSDGSGAPDGTVRVVTTSTVFADLIRNAGGSRVSVTSLVPAGSDVHTYQAKPDDLRSVAAADLIVMNGLGLDDWLEETILAASSRAAIVRLGPDNEGVELLPGDGPATQNPHLWLDVTYAELYVARIAAALMAADPANASEIDRTSGSYAQTLVDLDRWVRDQIATMPEGNRRLVTFHDALPYFAREYGLVVVGVAVEAPGQDPSAGEIAALMDAIRVSGVRAIFSEDQFPTTLVDQIGRETGATVVADLFTDSLGSPPVTSYEALIRWDVQRIVEALR
jgi:zinc/manganese transport system substrate-binding protein/manganese/iron transport system substrate-binding protein